MTLLRLCLLGSNCDMFQYGTDKTCKLMPHNSLKVASFGAPVTKKLAHFFKVLTIVLICKFV